MSPNTFLFRILYSVFKSSWCYSIPAMLKCPSAFKPCKPRRTTTRTHKHLLWLPPLIPNLNFPLGINKVFIYLSFTPTHHLLFSLSLLPFLSTSFPKIIAFSFPLSLVSLSKCLSLLFSILVFSLCQVLSKYLPVGVGRRYGCKGSHRVVCAVYAVKWFTLSNLNLSVKPGCFSLLLRRSVH